MVSTSDEFKRKSDEFSKLVNNTKGNEMDVIWEEEHLKVSYFMGGLPQVKIERHNSVPNDLIEIEANEFTEIASRWLELQGYDVVKREPEIAPCPNPECSNPLGVYVFEEADGSCYVTCDTCGCNSPYGETEFEAIRLHNLIAKRASHI